MTIDTICPFAFLIVLALVGLQVRRAAAVVRKNDDALKEPA